MALTLIVPSYALVYGLLAWVNTTGALPETWPDVPITVIPATHLGMAAELQNCLQYAHAGEEDYLPPSIEELYGTAVGVSGLYCDNTITINTENVDLTTPEGQGTLVHELVHWLQDHNGLMEGVDCYGELERQAYEVGWLWDDLMGVPRSPDEFTVMMATTCYEVQK